MDKQNIEDIKRFNKDQAEEQLASDIQAWLNDTENNTTFTDENLVSRYDEIQNLEEQRIQLLQQEQEEKSKRKKHLITEIQRGKKIMFIASPVLIVSAAFAGFFGIETIKSLIKDMATPIEIQSWVPWRWQIGTQMRDTIINLALTILSGTPAFLSGINLFLNLNEYLENKKELKQLNNTNVESEKKGKNL